MIVLDTNALIYFFRGQGRVGERLLAASPAEVAVAAVSVYELEVGIAKSSHPAKRRGQLNELLDTIVVLGFDRAAAQAAAKLRAELERRGRPIGPLDTLIAGTALAHRATLVTRNTREFSRVSGLTVVDWF